MTLLTETKIRKTKQSIIDEFNYALALIGTNAEELRLNAIVRRSFRKQIALQCNLTNDIGLLHQYHLIQSRQAVLKPSVESRILAIYNGRQCFGGAEIIQNDADAVQSRKLMKYELTLKDAGITEHALLVDNVAFGDIHSAEAVDALLNAIIKEADEQGLPSLCILGNTDDLRAMLKAARKFITSKKLVRAMLFALESEFDDASVLHVSVHEIN